MGQFMSISSTVSLQPEKLIQSETVVSITRTYCSAKHIVSYADSQTNLATLAVMTDRQDNLSCQASSITHKIFVTYVFYPGLHVIICRRQD